MPTKVGNTSVYSCSHTENRVYMAFVILLLKQLKYVSTPKYFTTDYVAV